MCAVSAQCQKAIQLLILIGLRDQLLGAAVIGSGVALFLCTYKKKGQKASPGCRKAAAGVLLICIAMTVGSGFMLAREIGQYKESADTYAGLSEYVRRCSRWRMYAPAAGP